MMEPIEMQGWMPYELKLENQLLCRWLNTLNKPFTKPFFDETMFKCRGLGRSHSSFLSVSSHGMIPGYHAKRQDEVFNKEAETPVTAYLDKAMDVYQRLEKKRMVVL